MAQKDFIGKWRITDMSAWDKEYFDEEVHAYVKIENNLRRDFHFCYVQCEMDGRILKHPDGEYLEFTFEGSDDGGSDDVSGSGWIKLNDKNNAGGEFRFHCGDDSTLKLRRI